MPELPEVESARRKLHKTAHRHTIVSVHFHPDPLVFPRTSPAEFRHALLGRKIVGTGRRGKNFWAVLDKRPWPLFHFGMSGSMHVYTSPEERPTHWKMEWVLKNGKRIAWRDPRRFGRIRLLEDPLTDPKLSRLGFDPLLDLPALPEFRKLVRKRKKNLKALLLDQTFSAGVGNWIADEILFQAKLSPKRFSTELSEPEVSTLRRVMKSVIEKAVQWDADSDKFPRSWLFHYRWNSRSSLPRGHIMKRETIAGRTTAWVPQIQT